MNKVIDDKIMETKRTLSEIHSVQHLVTLTLDAGDDFADNNGAYDCL